MLDLQLTGLAPDSVARKPGSSRSFARGLGRAMPQLLHANARRVCVLPVPRTRREMYFRRAFLRWRRQRRLEPQAVWRAASCRVIACAEPEKHPLSAAELPARRTNTIMPFSRSLLLSMLALCLLAAWPTASLLEGRQLLQDQVTLDGAAAAAPARLHMWAFFPPCHFATALCSSVHPAAADPQVPTNCTAPGDAWERTAFSCSVPPAYTAECALSSPPSPPDTATCQARGGLCRHGASC